jgi:hypothetical protein
VRGQNGLEDTCRGPCDRSRQVERCYLIDPSLPAAPGSPPTPSALLEAGDRLVGWRA